MSRYRVLDEPEPFDELAVTTVPECIAFVAKKTRSMGPSTTPPPETHEGGMASTPGAEGPEPREDQDD